MINCRNSCRRPAAAPSSVPHGSRAAPVPFSTFINVVNGGTESTVTKFADHTKLGGVDDVPSSCAVFQRDLGSWRDGLMWPQEFLNGEAHSPEHGRNSQEQADAGSTLLESGFAEKDLGIL